MEVTIYTKSGNITIMDRMGTREREVGKLESGEPWSLAQTVRCIATSP